MPSASHVRQKWQVTSLGDNYFKICAKYSGRCLHLVNGNQADGAPVQMWDFSGTDDQRWAVSSVGSSGTGDLLGPWSANGDYYVGSRVTYNGITYECLQTHHANSYWAPNVSPALWKVASAPTPLYSIVAKLGAKAIDVTNASLLDGAPIQLLTYLGQSEQIWTITQVP